MNKLGRKKLKIILVTQYFYPENFKSNDIAFELSKRGHDVTVLTGIPNYPEGKYYSGYSLFKNRKEVINGVKVIRSVLSPRGNSSGPRLALNYFSWAFFASIRATFLAIFNNYDKIIVHEPSPITQGLPAIVIKKLIRAPIIFWVLDLWPDSLISAGNIQNKKIISFFNNLTKFIYNHSDRILISSKSFGKTIISQGQDISKLLYFPNWSKDLSLDKNNLEIPKMPSGFILLFAGNIGEAQDMDTIIEGCKLLTKEDNIKIVLIGDGRKLNFVKDSIVKYDLEDVLFVFGRFDSMYMASFYEQADALLVSLKNEEVFNKTVPAKVQSYLSMSKPIIGVLNGEGSDLINDIKCGYTAEAGNAKDFIRQLKILSKSNIALRAEMGKNGYSYFKSNFELDCAMSNLENILYETE